MEIDEIILLVAAILEADGLFKTPEREFYDERNNLMLERDGHIYMRVFYGEINNLQLREVLWS